MNKLSASDHMLTTRADSGLIAIKPVPPHINARAYILVDAASGKILAEQQAEKSLPPASLTKIMTIYVAASALKQQQISLDGTVRTSKHAWQTPGSKMFLKEGQTVPVKTLVQGIIVDSGNDASVALAEFIAGSESNFAQLMNQQAKRLGMTNTHFAGPHGLYDKGLYTTAKDMAILTRALIHDFPEYYPWFKQRWLTFNDIKQPNRNRLLWRDPLVDGVKTGHTDSAAFCIVASAKKDGMRLIAVVMGAPNDEARTDSTQRLLNYGFRFYRTYSVFDDQHKTMFSTRVWKGQTKTLRLTLQTPLTVTIPANSLNKLEATTEIEQPILAPVSANQVVGKLVLRLNKQVVAERPLIALDAVDSSWSLSSLADTARLWSSNHQHHIETSPVTLNE